MIDVHMLVLGDERKDLMEQCIESLKDEPITLHICEGINGDLRTARINALSKGNHEYVGWVDPDDFIIPGAYQRLLDRIGDKDFAWSAEEVWYMDAGVNKRIHRQIRKTPHHMHIIKRSVIDFDIIRNKTLSHAPDAWVSYLACDGVFDDTVGYVWRNYPTSSAKKYLPIASNPASSDINK